MYIYIMLFFIYAFIGWLIEIFLTLFSEKRLVNRGFLIGPYIPIYGVGCIFLVLLLSKFSGNLIILFILTFLICGILEYVTGYALEKIFNLRWWDYKQFKFNLHGRVCLETLVPFTIGGVLAIKYLNPIFVEVLNKLPVRLLVIFELILVIIFIIDIIISNLLLKKMEISTSNKDDTEAIKNNMKTTMKKNVKKYIKKNHKS